MEALRIWWHAIDWLWGWATCIILPVVLYKWMTRGLNK